ncbi:MAG: biopolymer transporter ExbD [Nibricoccus sp.]
MNNNYSELATVSRKRATVQIIPLIDVVFFLLATFVLFTLMLNKILSVPVTLPVANGQGEKSSVVLQVSDAGVFWDGELITDKELGPRLGEYVKTTPNPRVLLAGDDKAKYGQTVAVLDTVRKAGIVEVCVETIHRSTGK